ncbi:hypothetical protein WDU94_011913 [Cyamophila willieti]
MQKHSDKLKNRINELSEQQVLQEQQEKELLRKRNAAAGSNQEGCESPMKSRKSRQCLFDPIRRWNSFHNSRDKKSYKVPTNTNLPYLQNLVQFKQQHSAKIKSATNEKFPFDYTTATSSSATSSPTLVSKGIKTVLKTSSQITNIVTDNSISSSLSDINCFRSPTKKQFSSPNLFLDPNKAYQKKSRRTSSDCYQNVNELERYTLSKNLSSSNPDDLVNLCPGTSKTEQNRASAQNKNEIPKNKHISSELQKQDQGYSSTYQKYACSSLTNSPVKFPKLPNASCDTRKLLDPNVIIRTKDMCSNMDESKRLEISRIMDDKRRKSDFTIDEIKRIIGDQRKMDDLRNETKTIDEDTTPSSENSSEHSRKSSTHSSHTEENFSSNELTKKIVTILQGDEKYFARNIEDNKSNDRLKRNLSIKLSTNESNKTLTPSCSSLTPLSTPSTPVPLSIINSTSAPLITTLPIPIVKTVQTPRIKALRSDSFESGTSSASVSSAESSSVPNVIHRNSLR